MLYVLLLATVCVAYTHRLIGPLRPFVRHVEKLTAGRLRQPRCGSGRGISRCTASTPDRLNELAEKLEREHADGKA